MLTQNQTIETRIRRDRNGWLIEARMPQGVNVFKWVIKGWAAGTKKDAERSEREIRAEMAQREGAETCRPN